MFFLAKGRFSSKFNATFGFSLVVSGRPGLELGLRLVLGLWLQIALGVLVGLEFELLLSSELCALHQGKC